MNRRRITESARNDHRAEAERQKADFRARKTRRVGLLYCKRCERTVLPKITQSGPHMRADCTICGRYIRFVSKNAA